MTNYPHSPWATHFYGAFVNVDDLLRELLPILYMATLEPSKWKVFLDRLSELAGISSGYLISSRPETGNVCLAGGGPDYEPETMALYNEQYGADDPFRAGFIAHPRTGVIDGEELIGMSDLMKTDMWNEVLSPNGLHHVTMLCGTCDTNAVEAFSLWRNSRQGPLGQTSLHLLEALAPHVQAALRINTRLRSANSSSILSETAFDALDIIVFLVNERGRVQHMNCLAAKRLPRLTGITIKNGRLTAADPVDDCCLQHLIRRAAASSEIQSPGRLGGGMTIRLPETLVELQISVLPAAEQTRINHSEPHAIIFIGEPRSAPRLRSELMREIYHLTATEARLADCLLQGKDLHGAAEALSITRATSRFHLKRVFAKTGARRQAELMRLMLSLPSLTDIDIQLRANES